MLEVPARVTASLATILLLSACTNQQLEPAASPTISPLSPSTLSQTTPPPPGSAFQNCRGGKNIHWWVARIENVTAADLEALAQLNLTNANRTSFDPSDADTLATWLKHGARARVHPVRADTRDNIFYALSAQLAVAVLNVRHEFVHESATFVLVDQANRELARENPSIGFMETLLYEFNRCQ